MKIKYLLVSLCLIAAFAGIGVGLYCAWPAITGTITNTKYYTSKDLQDAYDKGVEDTFKNKDELQSQVDYYKGLTDTYYLSILDYQAQVKNLENNNKDYIRQVEELTTQKTNLQSQVDNLTTIKTNNENTIASLNTQVTSLRSQVATLTNSDVNKSEQITSLNNQITNLQTAISQLQTTNDLNMATITSLNTQITSLNNQISEMTLISQNSQSQINALNNKITELQKSVTYYENYIASLENGEQVVATFEFDGSVYNIQIVNKGSKVSVVAPTSTAYKIFNGWTVDNEAVDLNSYTINVNTKFVADVTYKYDVKFMDGEAVVKSDIIVKDGFAALPTAPTKDGYEFDGWSINGVDIVENITTTPVTANTTYKAVWTKLHTVTFMYENEIKSTQTVRNGSYATAPTIKSTTYKVFNGWLINGIKVDVSTYKIVADTICIADIIYKYEVKFVVDNNIIDSQIIAKNEYPTLPYNPTKDGYEFEGWSINGVDIVENITTTPVTANTTYKAVWTKLHTVTFMYENEIKSTQTIRNSSYAIAPTMENTTHKLFNGWKFNNNIVNVANYPITQDITFVADLTYKYEVNFIVDNSVYSSQIVEMNSYVIAPTVDSYAYKTFNGWKVNNVIVDVSQYKITQNTAFYADFTINTAPLTAQDFSNYIYTIGQKNITSIVFDYFEDDNKYVVNGTNVLNGLSGTSLYNNKIMLYRDGTSLYVLSNYKICLDAGTRLFADMKNLASLVLHNIDTSNITDMSNMFSGCSSLTSLDLSNFNTSNVNNMSKMFENCTNLSSLNITSFNTSKVTNMSYMFYGCKNLQSVDVSSFNTDKVLYMMGMFSGCSKLTVLDISNFNTSLVKRFDTMFEYCSMLTTIYANEKFVTISVEVDEQSYIDGRKNMFFKCESLVGAMSYSLSKVDCSYANYETGYFTYKAAA